MQYFKSFDFELKYTPEGKNFLADTLTLMPQYISTQQAVVNSVVPDRQRASQASQVITRCQEKKRGSPSIDAFMQQLKQQLQSDAWFVTHHESVMPV